MGTPSFLLSAMAEVAQNPTVAPATTTTEVPAMNTALNTTSLATLILQGDVNAAADAMVLLQAGRLDADASVLIRAALSAALNLDAPAGPAPSVPPASAPPAPERSRRTRGEKSAKTKLAERVRGLSESNQRIRNSIRLNTLAKQDPEFLTDFDLDDLSDEVLLAMVATPIRSDDTFLTAIDRNVTAEPVAAEPVA
jgi:hypothetical protein